MMTGNLSLTEAQERIGLVDQLLDYLQLDA